jgi:hypothetical protein
MMKLSIITSVDRTKGWSYKKKGQVKTRKEEEEKGAASDANMHGNELYLDEMGITLLFVFLS